MMHFCLIKRLKGSVGGLRVKGLKSIIIIIKISYQLMFNPKEALDKIRRSKLAKEEADNNPNDYINNSSSPLFPDSPKQTKNNIDYRLLRLESAVSELTAKLQISNQNQERLKRENGQLETQLLKLEYENSQLRNSSRVSEMRKRSQNHSRASSNRIDFSQEHKMQGKAQQTIIAEQENIMPQVEEALEMIRREPLENILKRKEQNFRALRSEQKHASTGNKYLREFANISKQYGKNLKKPILVIRLDEDDFE